MRDFDTDELNFASIEDIEIAGTNRDSSEKDFDQWLAGIDLHADVDAIEENVAPTVRDLDGEAFAKLDPQELSRLVRQAMGEALSEELPNSQLSAPSINANGPSKGGVEVT